MGASSYELTVLQLISSVHLVLQDSSTDVRQKLEILFHAATRLVVQCLSVSDLHDHFKNFHINKFREML